MSPAYILSAFLIVWLLCFLVARFVLNKKQVSNPETKIEPETVSETPVTNPVVYKAYENIAPVKPEIEINEPIFERPVMSAKNKYLYPTDNFGKMEKGVVD